jgi:hypothetical protein
MLSFWQAIERMAQCSAVQMNNNRRATMGSIEARVAEAFRSGKTKRWFEGADDITRRVSQNVCGPVLAELAAECGYHDCAAADLFRQGGPVIGELATSGNGKPIAELVEIDSERDLKADR